MMMMIIIIIVMMELNTFICKYTHTHVHRHRHWHTWKIWIHKKRFLIWITEVHIGRTRALASASIKQVDDLLHYFFLFVHIWVQRKKMK